VRVVQVLVVDDHEPFREAAAAVIGATPGLAVAGMVGSGEESISAAHQHQVDLVLMDVNLPGMDGLTAAARLRELADPPIVVLVSTYDEEEFSDRLAEVGAAGYLAKSRFGADSLVRVWREATADRLRTVTTSQRHYPRRVGIGASTGRLMRSRRRPSDSSDSMDPPTASTRSRTPRVDICGRGPPMTSIPNWLPSTASAACRGSVRSRRLSIVAKEAVAARCSGS
jgi:DNA-binding NarL/FixJ family response regulator